MSQSMMTSSNGNIFRVTGHLCGEFTGPGEFPTQRPVTRSFDVYFDLRPNKWLSKQSWGWWFETLSCSLWRHRNATLFLTITCRLFEPIMSISFRNTARTIIVNVIRHLYSNTDSRKVTSAIVRDAAAISNTWHDEVIKIETFSALLALCAGNSPVSGEFPAQRLVTRSFNVFYDLRPNKRLSKKSRCWWFETPSRSLWRHCNEINME